MLGSVPFQRSLRVFYDVSCGLRKFIQKLVIGFPFRAEYPSQSLDSALTIGFGHGATPEQAGLLFARGVRRI